jgi:hypothetical protein
VLTLPNATALVETVQLAVTVAVTDRVELAVTAPAGAAKAQAARTETAARAGFLKLIID